jgi:hypothetical protein
MALNPCGKCGEMVDEAKAFCPGCGHSFVDEKQRTTVSDFDQSKRTVQLGETMFNQMLSEMGLNISKTPDRTEKSAEVVTPLAPAAPASAPKREAKPQSSPTPASDEQPKPSMIKIAVIGIAIIAFAMIVMLATVAALIFYYR